MKKLFKSLLNKKDQEEHLSNNVDEPAILIHLSVKRGDIIYEKDTKIIYEIIDIHRSYDINDKIKIDYVVKPILKGKRVLSQEQLNKEFEL